MMMTTCHVNAPRACAIANLRYLPGRRQGGDALERAHAVTTVIFDKTGTLTQGCMVVAGVQLFQTALTTDQVGTPLCCDACVYNQLSCVQQSRCLLT